MNFSNFPHALKAFAVVLTSLLGLSSVVAEAITPESAKVARVPQSVKSLDLSKAPTTDDIMAAGQLGGQLFPTHVMKDAEREKLVNRSFGEAIDQWNRHEYKNAVKLFKKHVEDYPDSPWVAEVDLHVGCDATYNGRYTEAEASFKKILQEMAGQQHEGAKVMVAKTKARLAVLNVYRNNYDDAKRLFGELLTEEGADWRDRTYASHWIQRLSRDTANKLALLNCGVLALAHLLESDGRAAEAREVRELLPQTMLGHSISDLSTIAMRYGFPMTGLRLTAADLKQLPLPAIMHIGTGLPGEKGHYWVLESIGKDTLVLYDPQAGRKFFQGTGEFLKEWSGVSLAFSGKKNLPGVRLLDTDMEQLFGGCCGVKRPENDLGCHGASAGPGSGCSGCSKGAPIWSVNMINLNFFVTDTPLWYQPSIGPSVEVSVSYNSQSAINQHEPFGNKWQFNYATYLVVDTGGQVTVFMPDGRRDQYSPNGSGGYTRPAQVFNTLTKIAENHFELAFPDGNIYVYNIPAGTTSLQPFLVEARDVHGQKLTFGYNANVQLTTITDATGKITTLTYNHQGLVTQATDPFGRSAHFEYDADRNLTKLTDMGGYWTRLTYDDNIYLTSLQNARGQRTIRIEPADGINNGSLHYPAPGDAMFEDYRITVTNPQGGKEEYYYEAVAGYGWYVSPRDYVDYVDEGVSNYSPTVPKTRYDYNRTVARGVISTITHPGGGQVAYGYDSNGNRTSVNNGAGTAYYAYNAQGSVTSVTDPRGAVTTTTYAANGVDPTQIQNTLGAVTMAYNAARQVASITDRLGKTTGFSYDGYGKLTTATDPLSQTTTLSYNAEHQLQQVSRGSQTTDTYTYDTTGRVKTHTDASGITLAYDYNNLDKVIKVTYPDGKFETTTYSDCCPHLVDGRTDRAGRWESYVYGGFQFKVHHLKLDKRLHVVSGS